MRKDVWYDYDNQAWVVDGKYENCGHLPFVLCRCYGREHRGETADTKHTRVSTRATSR